MSFTSIACRLIAPAVLALSVSGYAADTPAADAKAAAKSNVKKGATSTADLKKLIEEAARQRDAMIADYETLVKQFKDATDAQKQAIKEKMEAQKKQFEEVMNALHTQIRDEQRKQRQNAAGPGKR